MIHLDAPWDGYRAEITARIQNLRTTLNAHISFGYVDCDREPDLVSALGILNVPATAYYRGTELVGIIYGTKQDLPGNVQRLMRGEILGSAHRDAGT